MTRCEAIRAYCYNCSGFRHYEATKCRFTDRSLYPARKGQRPKVYQPAKKISVYCLQHRPAEVVAQFGLWMDLTALIVLFVLRYIIKKVLLHMLYEVFAFMPIKNFNNIPGFVLQKIPVMVPAQLRRDTEGKPRPQLSDFSDSTQIEDDVAVMFYQGDKKDESRKTYLLIEKNLDGPCKDIKVHFNAAHMRFETVRGVI